MLTWVVALVWLGTVAFSVIWIGDALCLRFWRGAGLPMPYRVFRGFARRRHRMLKEGLSERDRARYGSHLLHLDEPAVIRANRALRAVFVLGVLALGLAWPIRAMLPD
jgi:hypothetical protein